MSRIDEALRQSAGGIGAGRPEPAETGGPAREHADSFTLERYPRERSPEAGERRPRADRDQGWPAPPAAETTPRLVPVGPGTRETAAVVLDAAQAEQYRRLEVALRDAQVERGVRTLMITSARAREGTTRAAVNLALTLSQSHARVLLIDANLRQPSVHEVFGLDNDRGLSDWIQGHSHDLPVAEVSPHLAVLPAGQPAANPLPGLTSERMRVLLGECAGWFDWVVLDTPSVDLLPEAQLLARLTQGVVFVIGSATPFHVSQAAIAQLGRGAILGTVLNGIDE